MLRTRCVCGDIRQVDVRGGHAGQLDLCLLGSFLQTLHCHLVVRQVDALCLLEFVDEILDDAVVEVVAAEVGVAVGGKHFDDAVADVQDGHIERAAAEVVDHDLLLGFLVNAIGKRRCRRLVDDTLDFQTRNLAGVLGRLTLGVVEVSRNGDDSLGHGTAQIGFSVCLQLLQNHGGNFLRGVLLAVDVDLIVGAHVTLDRSDGALMVRDRLTLCDLTDHTLTGLRERHNGRGGAVAFRVCDNDGLAAFHNCYTAVGCTKINANNFTHS